MEKAVQDIRKIIRDIPDFPKPGIVFKDITPLLCNGPLFKQTIDLMANRYQGNKIDAVLGIESRGFIFGASLAYRLGCGFCVVRKPGKLPYETHSASYELEYGSDTLEIHQDGLKAGARVLIVDDLLATGGTAGAAADLVSQLNAEVVELAFLLELSFLGGRQRLQPRSVYSIVQYDSE
ncbi:MAG: adenine phosphoribosyltransferase [Deltaproteobacteria bacterium]|nr:adenine phosphoribosyltransferase [Deltaproteobacteria bacterium]